MSKVKGVPNKIGVEWFFTFPDEEGWPRLGTFAPRVDNCLSGDAEEVYTQDYPEFAAETVAALCMRITEAYNIGILKTDLSCREYFLKCCPDFIELTEWKK